MVAKGRDGKTSDASFAAWSAWAVSHPTGQLVCLFAFTLPFGIFALVTAADSYESLAEAVSSFQNILDNWQVAPPTAIEVVARTASCSSGYVALSSINWPGAAAGPCSCPDTSYQPFNTATTAQLNAGLSSVYGNTGSVYVGDWQTTHCSTSTSTSTYDTAQSMSIPSCGTYGGSCSKSVSSVTCSAASCYTLNVRTVTSDSRRRSRRSESLREVESEVMPSRFREPNKQSKKAMRTTDEGEKANKSKGKQPKRSNRRTCTTDYNTDTTTCTYYDYTTYTSACVPIPVQTSSTGTCSADQRKMVCVTDPVIASESMDKWRDSKICVKRNGQPPLTASGTARPDPADGTCPSGFNKCGPGNYNDNKATCTPAGTSCPITKLGQYTSTSDAAYVAADWTGYRTLSDSSIVAYRDANVGKTELPLAETEVTLKNACMKGAMSFQVGTYTGSLSSTAWSQSFSRTTQCKEDTRYIPYDTKKVDVFMQDNLNTYCPSPAPTTAHLSWTDNDAPEGTTGQYIYGVNSGSMNADSSTYCASGDALCSTVMTRTTCAKYSEYATAAGNTHDVVQSARAEIYYKIHEDCATKKQLFDAAPVIRMLRDAIRAQLICHYIAVIAGFIFSCIVIYRDYVGMNNHSIHDDNEQVFYHRLDSGFDVAMKTAKIVTIIISFIACKAAGSVFSHAETCTDKISAGQGFHLLDSTIKHVLNNTITNTCIEFVMLAFLIFSIYNQKAFNDYDPAQREREEEEAKRRQEAAEAIEAMGGDGETPPPPAPSGWNTAKVHPMPQQGPTPQPFSPHSPCSPHGHLPPLGGKPGFRQCHDPNTNRPYWINEATGQSTWANPFPCAPLAPGQAAPPPPPPVPPPQPQQQQWRPPQKGEYTEMTSAQHGNRQYWVYTPSGQSTWTDPYKPSPPGLPLPPHVAGYHVNPNRHLFAHLNKPQPPPPPPAPYRAA